MHSWQFSLAHLFVFITAAFTFRAVAPPTAYPKDNTEGNNTTDDNECNFPSTKRIGFRCKNKTFAQYHTAHLSRHRENIVLLQHAYSHSLSSCILVNFGQTNNDQQQLNSAFSRSRRFSYVCPLPQVF